jgi:poly(A) polymerase Pap1
LQLLQRVTVEFVQNVSRKKGMSAAAVEASGGKIFTYGSYRLGVYGPGKLLSIDQKKTYSDNSCWQDPISIPWSLHQSMF